MQVMEPPRNRKRPWEDESPNAMQTKRQGLTNAATLVSSSPLPPQPGYYSRNSQILDQRRLPPLCTSAGSTSAELLASRSGFRSPETQTALLLDAPKPRSQSLFDIFQPPIWRDTQPSIEYPISDRRTPVLDASPPFQATEVHRLRSGIDLTPHSAGAARCCPSSCEGQACSRIRILMRDLAAEASLLNDRVKVIARTEYRSTEQLAAPDGLDITGALQRSLELLKWSNSDIQEYLDHLPLQSQSGLSQPDTSPTMRRGQHHLEEREEQSPPARQLSSIHHGYFTHPGAVMEDSRRPPYGSEMPSVAGSPRHTSSSPGSAFLPPQSPMQAPQAIRTTILPSPSSLNFPTAPTLPSLSPPSAAAQSSAQSAHLQDLQHQISVKTLAFQTLQREYDSLLQKLERQRSKCATLEKKFEVSDVEINSLTDEKEKLQAQVAILESQVEELQQSRDEARRQLVANGGQYMRIMEMASRLQAQGAEDKKKWEAERTELENRIRLLEEAMVTGTDQSTPPAHPFSTSSNTSTSLPPNEVLSRSSQSETINVLRAEVTRLRSRTQVLETALQTMRRESISIQTAARQLVESGGALEDVAQGVLGNDG